MAVRTRPSDGRALPTWARIRPVGADQSIVHVTITDAAAVTADTARAFADALHAAGYRTIVTNAVTPADAEPLVAGGFVVEEYLDLLTRDLDGLARPALRTRRARRLDRIVALDARAFGPRAFDRYAVEDACRSTPAVRLRATGTATAPTAYAITGLAGSRAYLQRLAVDPATRRQGCATALALDGLRWAWQRGARVAMVNTHVDNAAAHALYAGLGFTALPTGLWVLSHAR